MPLVFYHAQCTWQRAAASPAHGAALQCFFPTAVISTTSATQYAAAAKRVCLTRARTQLLVDVNRSAGVVAPLGSREDQMCANQSPFRFFFPDTWQFVFADVFGAAECAHVWQPVLWSLRGAWRGRRVATAADRARSAKRKSFCHCTWTRCTSSARFPFARPVARCAREAVLACTNGRVGAQARRKSALQTAQRDQLCKSFFFLDA